MPNVQYCYYDSATMQVEAVFNSANLSINANCEAKDLLRAVVPHGMDITRNRRITEISTEVPETIITAEYSKNVLQQDLESGRMNTLTRVRAERKLDDLAGLDAAERKAVKHFTEDEVNAEFDRAVTEAAL